MYLNEKGKDTENPDHSYVFTAFLAGLLFSLLGVIIVALTREEETASAGFGAVIGFILAGLLFMVVGYNPR